MYSNLNAKSAGTRIHIPRHAAGDEIGGDRGWAIFLGARAEGLSQ